MPKANTKKKKKTSLPSHRQKQGQPQPNPQPQRGSHLPGWKIFFHLPLCGRGPGFLPGGMLGPKYRPGSHHLRSGLHWISFGSPFDRWRLPTATTTAMAFSCLFGLINVVESKVCLLRLMSCPMILRIQVAPPQKAYQMYSITVRWSYKIFF